MKDKINKYKEISNKILNLLKNNDVDENKIDEYFRERDIFIKSLDEESKIDEFRDVYSKELQGIDEEIKILLQYSIDNVKQEIVEYKKSKNVNFTYANMNKSNLNIFSKRV